MSDHSLALHIREYDDERRTAHFVASTDAIDSFGERVEQSWNLERYKTNPVVLYAHNSRALPIGSAEHVEVRDGQLHARIRFASEKANPEAEKVWQLIREKTLRAVSVGFVPGKVRTERQDDRDIYVLSDNDLHEISVVPIPANPEALGKMRAKARAEAEKSQPLAERGGDANHTNTESHMDEITKAKAALDEANRNVAETHKALQDERSKTTALEAKAAGLATERDAALERAAKAEAAVVKVELEALVGVKIAPAEVEGLAELAAEKPALYARQIAAIKSRADMKLLERTIGSEQNGASNSLAAGAGDEIVDLMNG